MASDFQSHRAQELLVASYTAGETEGGRGTATTELEDSPGKDMAHPISSSRDSQQNNNTQNNDIIPHNAIINSWWSDKRWIAKTLISSETEILLDQRLRHKFWVSREIVEKDWFQPPLPQETFTLSDVYWLASRPASDNEINAENGSGDFELEQLAILEMTLNRLYTVEPKAIKTTYQRQHNTDLVVIGNLSLWISKTILPKGSIFPRDEVPEGEPFLFIA